MRPERPPSDTYMPGMDISPGAQADGSAPVEHTHPRGRVDSEP
ncbi:hypothetical protein DB31_3378 [Hyalangium minutum]|uniref:Uncharacterized protein n=1 Tax=Hyalangium minutum TaxID=394096 RepID=A0A085WU85_9BACT|nr:hypothetical protein DB31_3378 [Hyalangium minutum]